MRERGDEVALWVRPEEAAEETVTEPLEAKPAPLDKPTEPPTLAAPVVEPALRERAPPSPCVPSPAERLTEPPALPVEEPAATETSPAVPPLAAVRSTLHLRSSELRHCPSKLSGFVDAGVSEAVRRHRWPQQIPARASVLAILRQLRHLGRHLLAHQQFVSLMHWAPSTMPMALACRFSHETTFRHRSRNASGHRSGQVSHVAYVQHRRHQHSHPGPPRTLLEVQLHPTLPVVDLASRRAQTSCRLPRQSAGCPPAWIEWLPTISLDIPQSAIS